MDLMKKEILSHSGRQTKLIGEKLVKEVFTNKREKGSVFSLEGELGSGKTTFLQGFAKELGVREFIKSPTFVIMKKYRLPIARKRKMDKKDGPRYFYHFDCYRITRPMEILELGFKEIIEDRGNVVTIEWGDKIKEILPSNHLVIKFKFVDKNIRKIVFKQ